MASWGLVEKKTGKTIRYCMFVPPEEIPEGQLLSCLEILPARKESEHPAVRFKTEHAEGKAKQELIGKPGKLCWQIDAFGSDREEVLKVVQTLEDSIGVLDLKPPLVLSSNLRTPAERIKFLLSWIAGR